MPSIGKAYRFFGFWGGGESGLKMKKRSLFRKTGCRKESLTAVGLTFPGRYSKINQTDMMLGFCAVETVGIVLSVEMSKARPKRKVERVNRSRLQGNQQKRVQKPDAAWS